MVAAMRSNGLQLIIAGAPASGKGTQCELLRETYGVVHLSTGDMLREAAKDPDSEVGKTAKVFMEAGQLVPDDVIIGVVVERLAKQDCVDKGWLLDGFPRTRAQADALSAAGYHPDQFIFLDVPDKILVTRVVGRRTDPETGKIYHMTFSPPENEEIAARLQQRSDDTEAKVQVRLKAFHENLAPILAVYKQQLLRVNGDADKVDIFNRTKERLDRIRRYSVVFVLGGPGSGKGTQCANIVREFGYTHLSAGDLLREEQNCGSDVGEMIKTFIKEGKIVPVEVTIRLLKTAMERSGARDFLIDGFPRSFENMEGWFNEMGDVAEVAFVLFFDCPEEVMAERLLKRGATSGRADDNEASIRKRFVTFRDTSMPVVEALARLGKVRIVSAAPPPEVVFARVSRFFKGLAMIPPTERTLAIIKPDAVAAGSEPAMIQRLEQEGFVIVEKKTETLTSEKVDGFYQEHIGKPFFEGLKKFMTSGPCTALSLERVDAIRAWRSLLGPTNSDKARTEKPDSLRALYGTDGQRNAAHGSDSTASAIRELAFWFPEATPATRTLAMIKPGAAETVREEIMCCIAARGFEVVKTASQVLPRGMAAEFYAEHTGKPFFEGLLGFMTSGEVVALMLKREAAVPAWRALMGPTNSNAARKTAPDSLRALFGVDGQRNATHGSDSAASAARECMFWFPDRWAAAAEATGESAAAEARVAAFMRDSVDPVLAPLLQRLVIAQPPDVVDFCVKELQALKRQAHS